MQKTTSVSLRLPACLAALCASWALHPLQAAADDEPDGIVMPGDKPPKGPRVDAMSEEGALPDGIVAPGEQPPKGPRLDGMTAPLTAPFFNSAGSLGWQPLPMGAWLALVWQR